MEDAARPPAAAARRRVAVLAAGVVALGGYLAGRALLEHASAVLAASGAPAGAAALLPLPAYLALAAAGVWVAVRLAGPAADPRPLLGRAAPGPTAGALILAAGIVAAVYAVAVAGGWAGLAPAAPTARLAAGLAAYAFLYAAIAVAEELVFRGALLGLLTGAVARANRTPVLAVAVTSALFALVHVASSATPGRLLGIFVLGVLLALLRLASASLWPAIAAHWAFHVLSYGAALGLPPLRVVPTGPVTIVGTPDQLDAGLLAIVALAVAAAAVAVVARRHSA